MRRAFERLARLVGQDVRATASSGERRPMQPKTSREDWVTPDHVPASLIVDFDFYNPPGVDEDLHRAWRTLRSGPDIVWSPHNGGHWIATRGRDIAAMMADPQHFSNVQVNVPREAQRSIPLGLDPPDHGPFRKLLMPAFLPKAVNLLEEGVRRVAVERIEAIAPRGACEFMSDFARVLPVVVFLDIVKLPQEDREMLQREAEPIFRSKAAEPRARAHAALRDYLAKFMDARAASPGEDLLSQVATAEIDGRPITRDEAMGVAMLLLAGGLDTVASLLGFSAHFLALNPGHRRQLIERPDLMPNAVEELIRRFGIANNVRTVVEDYDYNGVFLKKGDVIQTPSLMAGLDEDFTPNPLEVDFTRPLTEIRHAAFGAGPHTCPGAVLARREIRIFLETWLARMPDFRLKPGTRPAMVSGMTNGVRELWLSWDVAASS